jgi:hypothetical protein
MYIILLLRDLKRGLYRAVAQLYTLHYYYYYYYYYYTTTFGNTYSRINHGSAEETGSGHAENMILEHVPWQANYGNPAGKHGLERYRKTLTEEFNNPLGIIPNL